jgi:putative ABC transport system permease protein
VIDALRQDLKGAIRGLWKSPAFTSAALVTLALGIGATSAIFSVVKAVLLTPLPYEAPDRRVMVWSRWVGFDKTWVSTQEVWDYRERAQSLSAVAFWTSAFQNLTGAGEPMRLNVGLVSANTFDVLGTRPVVGRGFLAEEDQPNGSPVAVLGYDLWAVQFAGDPAIVGRKILLNDVPVEVVGVMPRGFRLPTDYTADAAEPTQLWRPVQVDSTTLNRGSHSYYAAAVLAPGASAASASAELHAIAARLTEEGLYMPAMQFTAFAVSLDDEIRGEVRPAMGLLVGAVGFLLLIACVNVANLLLVRSDARLREVAVRTAVGAAPGRLMRQLFTESIVLAITGAAIGLALAAACLQALMRVAPTSLPPLAPVQLDFAAVAFTMALAVLTTLLFGLVPALQTMRLNLVESLREGGLQATAGARRQRIRRALVAVEVGLAVVLVIGAGLMIRSLSALDRIDLGFNPDRVLTMRVAIPAARYETPEQVVGFYRELVQRVRSLPGVEQAGVVRVLPLATTIGDWGLDVHGFEETPERNAKGDWQIVSDGAFEAMGMRLLHGRWFTPDDTLASVPVAVVNETMAGTYWPQGHAVGGRIRVGNPDNPWVTVVGIVADERHNGVTGVVKEKFYIPHSQWHVATSGNLVRSAFVVVRTSGDPLAAARPVRDIVRQLDPTLPVANVRTMSDVVATALGTPRLTGFLLGAFAALALALATVGIYGVLAYLVSQRTQEIGIRLAMGAGRTEVLALILRQGLTLAGVGIAGGLAAAFLLAGVMQTLLYEVQPTDPLTFGVVALGLLVVAAVASYLPARRATKVSPLIALRTQ